MSDEMRSYAWVKVVDDDDDTPDPTPCFSSSPPSCGLIKSGHRPPGAKTLDETVLNRFECLDEASGSCVLRLPISDYPRWGVDSTFNGKRTLKFEVTHFVGSRDDAVRWMQGPDGKRWRKNAESYALMVFTPPGISHVTGAPLKEGESVAVAVADEKETDDCNDFKDAHWRQDHVDLSNSLPGRIFPDEGPLIEALGDKPPHKKEDCEEVRREVAGLAEEKKKREIRRQADDIEALKYVCNKDYDLEGKPFTMLLLDLLMQELRRPILRMKWHYKAGRPWNCCGTPTALRRSAGLFPANAAYPASHATLAHVAAGLMADAVPAKAAEFKARAVDVGKNRVIGGFHWTSDITGGERLADLMLSTLREDQQIAELLKGIGSEW